MLDVFRSPGNLIDRFGRSYSSHASIVSRLGAAFITAQQHAGVAGTAKHFPGLGSAQRDQDTDGKPVRLALRLSELRNVDEAPYRAAISAGVKLVMVSWATYPALDPSAPAGLSSRVIQGELRKRLHFKGVTITDAIGAGALSSVGSIGARSVRASQAGADLILACGTAPGTNSPQTGLDAVHAIAAALTTGRLDLPQVHQSTLRVLHLRSSL